MYILQRLHLEITTASVSWSTYKYTSCLLIWRPSYLLDNLLQNWSQCITKVSERKTNIAANSIEHSELYRIGELICYGAYLFKTFEIYDE